MHQCRWHYHHVQRKTKRINRVFMPHPEHNCKQKNITSTAGFEPARAVPNRFQELQEAILKTQKNLVVEDTQNGKYTQAEVDGRFDPDVMEFLVKGEVVTYRSMAMKKTYIYPFTAAIGDSKGQEERLKKIIDQLGWFAPSFDAME